MIRNSISLDDLNKTSFKILGCAYKVHSELGPGLLESSYEVCLAYELNGQNLKVEIQKSLPVVYKDMKLDGGYRIDLLVENQIIVEIKAVESLLPIHEAQLLTYLKLANKKLGLLINFNVKSLKLGIRRIIL